MSAGLAAIGLVKTADTGQVNWTTVLKPAASNTQAGYEVWRFNDALQATAPLFLRIGYGSGASNANWPSIWVSVGKGSDGAGTITSPLFSTVQCAANTMSSSTYSSYMCSGDGSMVVVSVGPALFVAVANTAPFFVVERSRLVDGTPTSTGVMLVTSNTAPTVRMTNYATPTNPAGIARFPVVIPVDSTDRSLASGGAAPIFPGIVHDWLGNFWQPRSLLCGMRSDLGSLSQISVPGFNTYLPLGAGAFDVCSPSNSTYTTFAMAWW